LFLFNDLLVYGSVKHKGSLYEYSDHIYIAHLVLKDISFKSSSKIGFQLVRNDESKQRDYIMLCRSLEDKQTWVHHIQQAIEESKNPQSQSDSLSSNLRHETSPSTPTIGNKKAGKDSSHGIMKAAIAGNSDAITQHLRDGFDVSAPDPETGQTMLHKLAHAGHSPLLHLLLESYSGNVTALVNQKDFSGATALHYAANTGQFESQKVLLSYGANPALLDDDQASPLHYASRSGNLEALAQFLVLPAASSLVFKRDSQGLTPAAYAAFHGNKDALEALLAHMRSSISAQPKPAPSPPSSVRFSSPTSSADLSPSMVEPLHFATMNNHIDCIEVVLGSIALLEKEEPSKRAGINGKDRQGLSAAHHAALNGYLPILELLHKRGADMQARDNTGGTVMHAACTGGSIECMKYLLRLGNTTTAFMSGDSGG
jgi:ankyrin repeat protein